MIKKTIAVISVAALAASAVALPQAVAAAPNSGPMIQLAGYHTPCSPCAATSPCSPCAAEQPCSPCAAEQPCSPCAATSPCNPCAATNPCNPCGAANPCGF